MIHHLRKHYAKQAANTKPAATQLQEAPKAVPAARSWSAPDPGVFASQKPVEVPKTKPETLDRKMVAELAKIAGKC